MSSFELTTEDLEDIWWTQKLAILSLLIVFVFPLTVGYIIWFCHDDDADDPRHLSDDEKKHIIKDSDVCKEEWCLCFKTQLPRRMLLTGEYLYLMVDHTKEEIFNLSIFDTVHIAHIVNSQTTFKFELGSSTNPHKIVLITNTKNQLDDWVKHIKQIQNKIHHKK